MSTARERPTRLAEKLRHIRTSLKLTQIEMIDLLGLKGVYDRAYISQWEGGTREPILRVLLLYARAYGVSTDLLIDDEADLPSKPSEKRIPVSQKKRSKTRE
jgi:transcriptional regulator with XRE-family HTH domain